jgi:arabinogalactan oligomer/maltooligosaccharide transport system permease protein
MNKTKPLTTIVIYAILVLVVFFAVFPIFFVVQASFRPGNQLYSTDLQLWPTDATLANYEYVLTQTQLPLWLWNTIKVGLATMALTLLVTVAAAYALSRFRFRLRSPLLTSMLALQAFPALLALIPIYLIWNTLGLINTHAGLILCYAAGATVFSVWNLKGYFDTIPVDLEEAGMIDGCSPTQAFLRIMLPLARPALAVTALFGFLAGTADFFMVDTLIYDQNLWTAPLGIISLQEGFRTPWGWFAAAGLILAIPVTLLFLALQRNFVSGATAGAVK